MANRRMFSRAITGSGRFLRLSAQARALYYDLGMEADDDGFVEAFVRLRATGAEEVHLRELEQAGLILVLDEYNLVVYIQDWSINNTIRRDRYTPSIYQSLSLQFAQAAEKPEPDEEPEADGAGEPDLHLSHVLRRSFTGGEDCAFKRQRHGENSHVQRRGRHSGRGEGCRS